MSTLNEMLSMEQNCFDFTEEEFNKAKSRELLKCHCAFCKKIVYRSKHNIQAIIKNNKPLIFCSVSHSSHYFYGTEEKSKTVKCATCGKEFDRPIWKSKSGLYFCSHSCSAKHSNATRDFKLSEEQKHKISSTLKERYFKINGHYKEPKKCKVCGQEHCLYPQICKSSFIYKKSNNMKNIGFDFSTFGSFDIYDEYYRMQYELYHLYYIEEYSLIDIKNLFNIPSYRTITLLYKFFNIPTRTISDSLYIGYKNNRVNAGSSKNYKSGYHISWENKQFFYRSSYELDYMLELDSKQISYDYESLRIPYYDTISLKERIAIPDFYLPDTNTIVEVKSNYTYNKQNMIDKSNVYKSLGYNFILLLEHRQFNYCV